MKKPASVEEYIGNAPPQLKGKLEEIRRIIRETAPQAEEKISYGMPYYGYKGRLAYFALAKNHIGLYIPPPIIANHAAALKKYKTSISAIQFPLNEKLPIALIEKLVRARLEWNGKTKNKR